MRWEVDPTLMCSKTPPTSNSVPSICQAELGLSTSDNQDLLDSALSIYIGSCLQQLTQEPLGALDFQQKAFFDWMRIHQSSARGYDANRDKGLDRNQVLHKARQSGILGELIFRAGSNLTAMLQGHVDINLLMDKSDPLICIYEERFSLHFASELALYIKRLAFKKP